MAKTNVENGLITASKKELALLLLERDRRIEELQTQNQVIVENFVELSIALNEAKRKDSEVNSDSNYKSPYEVEDGAKPNKRYKVILCGDSGAGKTSFLLRSTENRYHNDPSITIGVDYRSKKLRIDDQIVDLQIWDTAGQERFRCIVKSYFRQVDGALIIVDVANLNAVKSIKNWIDLITKETHENGFLYVIVISKIDLLQTEQTYIENLKEIQTFIEEINATMMTVSSKLNHNNLETLAVLTRAMVEKEDLGTADGQNPQTLKPKGRKADNKKTCVCGPC